VPMSSSLALVPVPQRRKVGVVTGGFALLLTFTGVLPWTTAADASVRLLSIVALLAGVFLALVSWGMFRSASLEASDRAFDEAVTTVIANADIACSCGHEHDPDHLEFADEPADGCAQVVHRTGSSNEPHTCGGTEHCSGAESPACATCVLTR
jgi:hypothetical protein